MEALVWLTMVALLAKLVDLCAAEHEADAPKRGRGR